MLWGGSADVGYSCTEEHQTVFDKNVTTIDDGRPHASGEENGCAISDVPSAKVTFNGTEYVCEQFGRVEGEGFLYYNYGAPEDIDTGGYDFSEYPFLINVATYGDAENNYTVFCTPTAGTYSFKIEIIDSSVETTPCFEKAVKSVVGNGGGDKFVVTTNGSEASHTSAEIKQAFDDGRVVELHQESSGGVYIYQPTLVLDANVTFVRSEYFSSHQMALTSISVYEDGSVVRNATNIS